jgi:hypothetical protein
MAAWHRRLLYASGWALLITGMLWLWLHGPRYLDPDAAAEPSPLEPWLLRAHGAAALLAIFCWGGAVTQHVTSAWVARRHRSSGIGMLSVVLVLSVTGYLLYYASSDLLRVGASGVHWLIGLCAPVAILAHVIPQRLNRRRDRQETARRPLPHSR